MNEEQLQRYHKNVILDEVGPAGQEKLFESSVLVTGTGGLGSPVIYYLAAAGVGTLGLIDGDVVEQSNLQRQVIHSEDDIGKPKVFSAAEKVRTLNSGVKVNTYNEYLDESNYIDRINGYDVVVDGTDNFKTRFLINEASVRCNNVYIHGGVSGFSGQAMTIIPGRTPCLRCIFPETPGAMSSSGGGVLTTLPGVIGTILATEVLKYLTGAGDLLAGRILTYDALSMQFFTVEAARNPGCRICDKK